MTQSSSEAGHLPHAESWPASVSAGPAVELESSVSGPASIDVNVAPDAELVDPELGRVVSGSTVVSCSMVVSGSLDGALAPPPPKPGRLKFSPVRAGSSEVLAAWLGTSLETAGVVGLSEATEGAASGPPSLVGGRLKFGAT